MTCQTCGAETQREVDRSVKKKLLHCVVCGGERWVDIPDAEEFLGDVEGIPVFVNRPDPDIDSKLKRERGNDYWAYWAAKTSIRIPAGALAEDRGKVMERVAELLEEGGRPFSRRQIKKLLGLELEGEG